MSAAYQHGDTNPVMAPVASATAIAQGDLLASADTTGLVTPAASFTWDTNIATTRAAFVLKFLGVSAQVKDANADPLGNTGDNASKIRVMTSGVVRFLSPAAGTYVNGLTWVGPAKDTGNALTNQTMESVASLAQAIGMVVGGGGTNPSYIDVLLYSRRQPIGPTA